MKRILLVTDEGSHGLLYGRGLAKHFKVEFTSCGAGAHGDVDAVVYDVPKYPEEADYDWLEAMDVPVIVLTRESELPLPKCRRRRVLLYPARMKDILRALTNLGICQDEKC